MLPTASSYNLGSETPTLQFTPDAQPRVSEPIETPTLLELKKDRAWVQRTIKDLYFKVKAYAACHSKVIDALTAEDLAPIAAELNKSPHQCLLKLREVVITDSFRPGQWSKAEDELLRSLIQENRSWKDCAVHLNATLYADLKVRTGKQCRERWNHHLNPTTNRGRWTLQEDCQLMEAFLEIGSQWSSISKQMEGRNETLVKNRARSLFRAELKNFGVADQKVAAQRIIARNLREINADYSVEPKH